MSKNVPPIALIDCNNFFVSCERLFRPDLTNRPVVVLSSNDGCIISRSNEAKVLGFKMGEPYFRVREKCVREGVTVFSSNFDLYRDISRRVMHVLRACSENVEVYSVDEAFLELPPQRKEVRPPSVVVGWAKEVRETVLREVGIPVTVGIAHTKTLAKVASYIAKEAQKAALQKDDLDMSIFPGVMSKGVGVLLDQDTIDRALCATPVGEVWGVGFRLAPQLMRTGVTTAHALCALSDVRIRARMSIRGLRTVHELRGHRCFAVGEDVSLRKSLLHSQSFGAPLTRYTDVRAAVAHHARKVAEVLRAEGAVAYEVGVLVRTSRHRQQGRYAAYDTLVLERHTNDTLELVRAAEEVLQTIYKPGIAYAKAGVSVRDIVPEGQLPAKTLFGVETSPHAALMEALDAVRHSHGDVVQVAAEGTRPRWGARHALLSPRYTSSWRELRRLPLPVPGSDVDTDVE